MTRDDETEEGRERAHLSDTSDALLRALRELRDLERRKRDKTISTEEFHELADRIEARSRNIFRLAAHERDLGESIDTQVGAEEDTIDAIADEPSTGRARKDAGA